MASPVTCMGSSTWTTLLFRDKPICHIRLPGFHNLQKSDNNTNRILPLILFWPKATHPHPYPLKSVNESGQFLMPTVTDILWFHSYEIRASRASFHRKGLAIVAILPRKLLNRETCWTYVQLVDLTGLRAVSILTLAVFSGTKRTVQNK